MAVISLRYFPRLLLKAVASAVLVLSGDVNQIFLSIFDTHLLSEEIDPLLLIKCNPI
jgi:hypothetical protein